MSHKYDVLIVGSGIGGLAAGVLLSKKGRKVLIIEQGKYAGGYCSSFKRGEFVFDSAAHVIGSYNKNCSFWKLIKSLDIDVDLIRLSPTDRIRCGDGELIEIPVDCKKYENYLEEKFKGEAPNIRAFFNELYKMADPLYAASVVKKYSNLTYQEYLDSFFKEIQLKGILSAHCGFVGLPPNKASALSALFTLKMFAIEGAYYPRGGAQSLANAFLAKFKKNGGEIIFGNEVVNILINGNRVTGLRTQNDEIYEANFVISNIDCKKTYLRLINSEKANIGDDLKYKLNTYTVGMSCFILYLATNNRVETDKKNGWYYPSYNINEVFNELLYLHIPSNYDLSVAPADGRVIVLVVPYNKKITGDEDWGVVKKELTSFYMKKLEHIFPGLTTNLLKIDAATPRTLERYTSNMQGAAYGWEQTPQQMYMYAFPSRCSIEGLFLAGHWTFPGGGVVSAALSGINTARQITKREKI